MDSCSAPRFWDKAASHRGLLNFHGRALCSRSGPFGELGYTSAVAIILDYNGRPIRITAERWAHISRHPEMTGMELAVEETINAPQAVLMSATDPSVWLYNRLHKRTAVGERLVCVVVKVSGEGAFVVAADLTDRVKRGEILWERE